MKILIGERDASKSFTAAYDTTLKPHHNWFVQKAFTVGLKMVPDFQGFLDAMTGPDFKGDKVCPDLGRNGSVVKNPEISGAIFTLNLSILILNSQCVEGARDFRVL